MRNYLLLIRWTARYINLANVVGEIAWLLPVYQTQLPWDVNKHHPTLRKWLCTFPTFPREVFRRGYCYYRTPAAVEAEATLLLSLPSLGFISFSVTLSLFASVRGGTERLYRGNHTQTPDKHTHPAATAMFVLTGSVFFLSLSLIHTLRSYTTCGLVVYQLTISVI